VKIEKRDLIFVGLATALLALIVTFSGKEKTTPVANNETHKQVYEIAYKKAPGADASIFKKAFFKPDRKEAEKLCEPCHQQKNIKLPPNHPPKYRCLFCHKLAGK
jgi:hypothetical protein